MLGRRRGIILVSMAACFLLAILALMFSTRRYKSVGEIELQKDATASLGFRQLPRTSLPTRSKSTC